MINDHQRLKQNSAFKRAQAKVKNYIDYVKANPHCLDDGIWIRRGNHLVKASTCLTQAERAKIREGNDMSVYSFNNYASKLCRN